MLRARIFCALLFCLPLTAQVFPTGDPVIPPSGRAMRPLTPTEYKKIADGTRGHANVKVVRQLPPSLSPDYRLVYNFVYESANHGWILDRDAEGYKLFLDLKGDGDLSNSQPLRFELIFSAVDGWTYVSRIPVMHYFVPDEPESWG